MDVNNMRIKKDILDEVLGSKYSITREVLTLEVLIDIRDALVKLADPVITDGSSGSSN